MWKKAAIRICKFLVWLNGPCAPLWLFTILVAGLFVYIVRGEVQ